MGCDDAPEERVKPRNIKEKESSPGGPIQSHARLQSKYYIDSCGKRQGF